MKTLNAITLSALLHDIGKLYQRCGDDKLTDYNMSYCPEYKGHSSHLHTGFTAQFFDNEEFENIFKTYEFSQSADVKIRNLSANHHKPSGAYDWFITAADRLASGFERDKFSEYETLTAEEEKQQFNYKKARLISIFSGVKIYDDKKKNEKFYNLEKLSPDILPADLQELSREEAEKEYQLLKDAFEKDLLKIDNSVNFNNFYNALLTLFEKYFWCIPSSSYHTLADVSLFDHLKTTASIATALYIYHKERDLFYPELIENYSSDEHRFVLVQGDFSGIQDFIFSRFGESNKFAAKILRAKSFYVSMFTEIAAYLIIEEFGSNASSIILNAGGKFTLLLPNIEDYQNKINNIKERINNYFLEMTFGQTRFNIAYTELSGYDFTHGLFSKKMEELSYKLRIDKLKPVVNNPIFENYLDEVSSAGGVCAIDGYQPKEKGANEKFSKYSKMFKQIGENLPKSDFINIYFSSKGRFSLLYNDVTFDLSDKADYKSDLIFRINITNKFSGYAEKMLAYYIPLFSEKDLNSSRYAEMKEDAFDKSDFKVGGVKSFYHIAVDAKEKIIENGKEKFTGKSFLGILKTDIDNLGNIFSKGFGANVTISKIASLSRMFDYFFTGWLPNKIKENYKSIYTVFAGGDDLFLIGPYNQIVQLSADISQHLRKYSAENPDIHISAGIVLKKEQVPVYQMADAAENALEKSKQKKGKNSITIFDQTVRWNEYEKFLNLTKYIDDFIKKDVKTTYLYKMLTFIEMNDKLKQGNLIFANRKNAMWIAYLNYLTVRNYKDELKDELLNFFYGNIEKYGKKFIIPISLSLYKRRN